MIVALTSSFPATVIVSGFISGSQIYPSVTKSTARLPSSSNIKLSGNSITGAAFPFSTVITTSSGSLQASPSLTINEIVKGVVSSTSGAVKVGIAEVGSLNTIPSGALHKNSRSGINIVVTANI